MAGPKHRRRESAGMATRTRRAAEIWGGGEADTTCSEAQGPESPPPAAPIAFNVKTLIRKPRQIIPVGTIAWQPPRAVSVGACVGACVCACVRACVFSYTYHDTCIYRCCGCASSSLPTSALTLALPACSSLVDIDLSALPFHLPCVHMYPPFPASLCAPERVCQEDAVCASPLSGDLIQYSRFFSVRGAMSAAKPPPPSGSHPSKRLSATHAGELPHSRRGGPGGAQCTPLSMHTPETIKNQ